MPRRLDFGSHIGQFELNRLEFADRFAKLLPLLRVARSCMKCALRHPQRQRGNRYPAAVKYL